MLRSILKRQDARKEPGELRRNRTLMWSSGETDAKQLIELSTWNFGYRNFNSDFVEICI